MRLLVTATPRQMLRWAFRTFAVAMPLCLLQMAVWALGVHPLQPTLALMVYLLLLATSACAVVVASLASCHLAIHQAFGAGWRAGVEENTPPDPRRAELLRAVE